MPHYRTGEAEGALFGVPISMKESFDVAGMQTTGGLIGRKGFVQEHDAEVVRKLKAEGAIIIGKTNTPELCFCQETDNKLYGRTNNPWNLERTAGGSSGGEGAAIAIGACSCWTWIGYRWVHPVSESFQWCHRIQIRKRSSVTSR